MQPSETLLSKDVNLRVVRFWCYLLAASVVLSSNTLYGSLVSIPLILVIVILMTAFTFLLWRKHPIDARFLRGNACWALLMLVPYAIVGVLNNSFGGMNVLAYCLIASFSPLLIWLLRERQIIEQFILCYTNVVSVLAGSSIILWLLGPVFGLISPSFSIESTWTDLGNVKQCEGYLGLCFVTQNQSFFGMDIARNTGIFTEAPMYSFSLCVALACELLVLRRSRVLVSAILAICVITTFSSTGYVILVLLLGGFLVKYVVRRLDFARGVSRVGWITLLTIVGAVVVGLCFYLISARIGTTGTGDVRIDDFRAGFLAWIDSPLYGSGFSSDAVIQSHMSEFRYGNMGFSSSPMKLLASGGILVFLPTLIGLMGYFSGSCARRCAFGSVILLMWAVTIVWTLPVMALLVGGGSFTAIARKCSSHEPCLSLSELVAFFVKHVKTLVVSTVVCAILCALWVCAVVGPQYHASAMLVVVDDALSEEDASWLLARMRSDIPITLSSGTIGASNLPVDMGNVLGSNHVTAQVNNVNLSLTLEVTGGNPINVVEIVNDLAIQLYDLYGDVEAQSVLALKTAAVAEVTSWRRPVEIITLFAAMGLIFGACFEIVRKGVA